MALRRPLPDDACALSCGKKAAPRVAGRERERIGVRGLAFRNFQIKWGRLALGLQTGRAGRRDHSPVDNELTNASVIRQVNRRSVLILQTREETMGHAYDPRRWYFTVTCERCGETIALALAPSPEQDPDPMAHATQLPCPNCHTEGFYLTGQIERRQGAGGGLAPY